MICGYYGHGNGGDEALLATLLEMLPQNCLPVVITADRAQTEKLHQVATIDRSNFAQIFQELQRSDYFVWGGGSLMQDVTSWRSPLYYGGLMRLAQVLGLTTIAWAQGVGPFRSKVTAWWTKHSLQNCSLISVRDDHSARLLQSWGLSVSIAPDPVWALTSSAPTALWDLPAPRVAVCLRSHPLLTPQRLDVLGQALRDFQQATQTYILLVPFQQQQDSAVADILAHKLPPEHRSIWRETNPRLLKGLFRGVEMAIAMRLHGVIMSASVGCRCFGLSYDPKVRVVMDTLGLDGYDLQYLPDQPEQITKDWLDTYANGTALDEMQISALVDRAQIHQQLLLDLMDRVD